jgi:cytochrome c2
MHKQLGKIGTARREIRGQACSFCGGRTYQLLLRPADPKKESNLFAQCSQCHHPRSVGEDFGTVLWM